MRPQLLGAPHARRRCRARPAPLPARRAATPHNPMGHPPRKVRVRPAPGDTVEVTHGQDGSLHVVVRSAGNGKSAKEPPALRWTDKLRSIYEAAGDKPQSREEVMTRAGYALDTHAHDLVRRLVRAGWLTEEAGLVRRNPSPPGQPPC